MTVAFFGNDGIKKDEDLFFFIEKSMIHMFHKTIILSVDKWMKS